MKLELMLDFLCGLPRLAGVKICLKGPLGAGKTHLVKALAQRLQAGLEAEVQSPSFNLYHQYAGPGYELQHFDLYRLESPAELDELGIFESLDDPTSLTLIEWGDLFAEILRLCHYVIEIHLQGDGSRDYFVSSLDQMRKEPRKSP